MEYPTSHLYFLNIHIRLKVRVYNKKPQITRGISHDTEAAPRESTTF